MEEGGSIAKRERDNQQNPSTIGTVAALAPDVEGFKVQDFSAEEGQEQAAGGGPTTAMPEAANRVAEAVPSSAKNATDAVSRDVKEAVDTDATKEIKEQSGATFKK